MKGFKENFNNFIKGKYSKFRTYTHYLDDMSQEKILSLQERKKAFIDRMHELLQKVDRGEEVAFETYGKSIIKENNNFFIFQGGEKTAISRGDIMVAGMNGFDLKLGAEIPRDIKKEFILREIRRRIKELYNQQLIVAELENKNKKRYDGALDAYREIAKTQEEKIFENRKSGLLAEKMVESYLTKLFIDNPQLPFDIEIADVYDDVRRKIDFKLSIKKEYVRGVKINQHSKTGIQFTLNEEKIPFKEKQIENAKRFMKRLDKQPVDDLVLVSMPIKEIQDALDKWQAKGKKKDIAGPSEQWADTTKKEIFTTMLKKLPLSLNINPEELWESIQKQKML